MIAAGLFMLLLAQTSPEVEATEAAAALATCAVPYAQSAASGTDGAEAIADAALAACTEPQARMRSVFARMNGDASAETGMQMVIGRFRDRLIRVVNARRGLASRPDTPATAWGDCVRAKATELASHEGAVETMANEAMRQCPTEEALVRTGLASNRDLGREDQLMAPIVAMIRNIAIQTIRQVREAQHP